MSTLYIFRGLPGSGKTTEANKLGCIVISAQDMYAMRDGEYKWSAQNTKDAKLWAENILGLCLRAGVDVAIAEVMPKLEKVKMLIDDARGFGYNCKVTDLIVDVETSLARNIHNVPEKTIRLMDKAFEPWSQ